MWQKIELYIISLWLLFALLFINKIQFPICFDSNCSFIGFKQLFLINIVPTFSLIFLIVGGVFYFRFDYNIVKAAPSLPKKITKIENMNFETLSFLITYIIPLVCFDLDFDLDKNRNLLMLVLILILIGCIYVRTNIFYTNPALALLGYRIYKIDTTETKDMIVIVKGKIKISESIYPVKIDENIYFVKQAKKDD